MARQATRRQRVIRALTPRRVRRAQARWRRRARKTKQRYARFREVVRRDPQVTCGACGKRVAQPKLKAHLARHDAQATKTSKAGQRKRATCATCGHGSARRPSRKDCECPRAKGPCGPNGADPCDPGKPVSRRVAGTSRRTRQAAAAQTPPRRTCDGTCTNSNGDAPPGACGMCCGRKELITNFGGRHRHVPCGSCGGTGRDTSSHKAGSGDTGNSRREQPSRAEAGSKAAPWFVLSSGLMALTSLSPWFAAAGSGAMAAGGLAYRYEREHGTSEYADRADRDATKQAARAAGCSAACMNSSRPVETCRCPCGGATHGAGRRGKAAA